ncbi:hypothetical protein ACWCQL_37800 [Streptomyces sp. NPDC002073]
MGGAARLSSPALTNRNDFGLEPKPVTPSTIHSQLNGELSGEALLLDDSEWVSIDLKGVPKCFSTSKDPADVAMVGSAADLTGSLQHPVRDIASFMWWDSPRESQSWPLIGRPPNVSDGHLGVFRIAGIEGSWIRSLSFSATLSIGSLGRAAQVESSRPAVGTAESLSWYSRNPIQPFARLIDLDTQERWQNMLVAAGVGLGIGGSLLTSLLFEQTTRIWSREPQAVDPGSSPASTSDGDSQSTEG